MLKCIHCPYHPIPCHHHFSFVCMVCAALRGFSSISGTDMILTVGRFASKSIPRASLDVLVRLPVGSSRGPSSVPLSFAKIFLTLVTSGILSMDLQKPASCLLWHFSPPSCTRSEAHNMFPSEPIHSGVRLSSVFFWCSSWAYSTYCSAIHSYSEFSSPDNST